MAEVIDLPAEPLDRRRDRNPDQQESPDGGSPSLPLPPPPPRMRDRSPPLPPPPPPPGPPPGPPRAGRDREYRRRSSPSPPPYSYRDHRHSPPRRSPSPGPFKRSRRDDGGGYERRRGSPRRGYGSEDRRYGYDYGSGYDRGGSGNRGGYIDEKAHGRYLNQQSEWPDSGHGRFNDVSGIQREGLMTYKQFIQVLEDDILPAEAERRYQEYKTEYITTQKRAYFDLHKQEDWLKDKYHPTNLVSVIERRNERAKSIAKEFLLDLQSGTVDLGPGPTVLTASKSGNGSDANSEEETDSSGRRRRYGRGLTKENNLLSDAPRAHPVSCEPRRIQIDIQQAQALVRKLDSEKGIEGNILASGEHDKSDVDKLHGGSMGPIIIIRGLNTVKGLEGVELLDTLLTYLWRVHALDYYGVSEMNEAKGPRHVRGDDKISDGSDASGADWEKKLDSWQERLCGQDTLEILMAKEKIDAAAVEALDPYVRKIRDEKYGWKYGCGAKGCTKLFHAPEYVHKHLKLKHPDLVMESTSKVREDIYFQNYMNDQNAPGGSPVMQQSAPKDKIRRRPGLDNRLRDERGSHRQYDRADRDDERYNRADGSPTRDANCGSEGGNLDEPMYDAYGGQGTRAASFLPEFPPPPVLMPVPGAGPLGPFVPAPPEVAMHMLRERGPTSFEANGGPHGRKTVPGPAVGSSAPLIALPPPFRHDPRRIRSYQDLDAPEEEVNVIDYRSL